MKKIFACLLLLFVYNYSFTQTTFKTYTWDEAKLLPIDSVFSITFEKEKLDSIPIELIKFIQLKRLDLSKNNITQLPPSFIQLNKLEVLDLGKNKLATFPIEICQLNNLKQLKLNRNFFEYIPDCICNLTKLEYLDLWSTPLSEFPEAFTLLKSLKVLDCRGVSHGPKFQKKWIDKLSWVKIEFDQACDCVE